MKNQGEVINGVPVYSTTILCSILNAQLSAGAVTELTGVKPMLRTDHATYWRQSDVGDIALRLAQHFMSVVLGAKS